MVDFLRKPHYNAADLRELVEILRGEGGCPWDRKQTHESLRRFLLEETAELCEAIDSGETEHLREELGDVYMQILFHASIEQEKGSFDLDDVADAECRKLIHRHPNVFGSAVYRDDEELLDAWEKIKQQEKAQVTASQAMDAVCRALPGLWRAEKVQKKAAATGFDWDSTDPVLDKLGEETEELRQAIQSGDRENIQEELGDLLFCAVNAARLTGIDPEKALHRACEKFIRRFRHMEERADTDGKRFPELPISEMLEYYQLARMELEHKSPPEGFHFETVTLPER